MATSVPQFLIRLRESQLLSDAEVQTLEERTIAENEESSTDARRLAQALVEQNKLTPYQATAVYKGLTHSLRIGNYDVLDRIGAGGMGTVFKARHRVMQRVVAMKVLPRKLMSHARSVKRFRREVRAAAQLEHPNVVRSFDADVAHGVHFLVMEHVDGSDLSRYVKEKGPLPVRDALACIIQAAQGLEYAHSQGIIHRDVKPSNLLLDTKGNVKVLDLGLARIEPAAQRNDSQAGTTLTTTGAVMGTVDYMSPEQALDAKLADHRSDVYSLGYTLYYLLTGRKPYSGDSMMQILMAHQQRAIPSLREARGDVPASLEAVFQTMVAKDRDDRYPSMADVVASLQSIDIRSIQQADPGTTLSVTSADQLALESFQEFLAGLDPADSMRATGTIDSGDAAALPRNRTLQHRSRSRRRLGPMVGVTVVVVPALIVAIWALKGDDAPNREDDFAVAAGGVSAVANSDDRPTTAPNGGAQGTTAKQPDYALSFDGIDDHVVTTLQVPFVSDPARPEYTMEAIVRPRNIGEPAPVVTSANSHLILSQLGLRYMVQPELEVQPELSLATPAVRQLESFHVAGVLAEDEMRIYVNGREVASRTVDAAAFAGNESHLSMARWMVPESRHFCGTIDEVRVSKVARYDRSFDPPSRHRADVATLALYHFDEGRGATLTDHSGKGHHGTIYGATWVNADGTPMHSPPADTALWFDGEDDYVEVTSIDEEETDTVTLEALVHPLRVGSHSVVVQSGSINLVLIGRQSRWMASVNGIGRRRDKATGPPAKTGSGSHVAAVKDGPELRLFVGGQLVAQVPAPAEVVLRGVLFARSFRGTINEVRISKTARYREEFVPETPFEPDEDTIALYHFDEAGGSLLKDHSGNGHDGTIHGATWVNADGTPIQATDIIDRSGAEER